MDQSSSRTTKFKRFFGLSQNAPTDGKPETSSNTSTNVSSDAGAEKKSKIVPPSKVTRVSSTVVGKSANATTRNGKICLIK